MIVLAEVIIGRGECRLSKNGTRLVSLSLSDGTVNSFHVKCNQNVSCNKCLLLFRGNFSKCDVPTTKLREDYLAGRVFRY